MENAICFLLALVLTAIAVIDWKKMIIPNYLVLAVAALAILSFLVKQGPTAGNRVIGCLAVSMPMAALNIFIKRCFGMGDVKLCAAAGLLLGYPGMLLAMFLAVLTGGSYAVFLLIKSRENRNMRMPFGPFLAAGIWIAYVFGEELIGWYLKMLEGGWGYAAFSL